MKNITEMFLDIICDLNKHSLPERVSTAAKLRVLDYLGCAYAGSAMQREQTNALLEAFPDGGSAAVIGTGKHRSPMTAALVNAFHVHKTELDDGHRFAMLHPGAPVISALLSAAVADRFSMDSFLRGVVAGYEAAIRLGQAIQPTYKIRGGYATGVCGVVAAAVAISTAAGFDRQQMKSSIAAATDSASGLLESDPTLFKPYKVGHAALGGYVSAYMGKCDLLGPDDPLGGNRGFLRVLAGSDFDDKPLLTRDFVYRIEQTYTKIYAACRHSHPAVEAALLLAEESGINPERISGVDVKTYHLAIPGHDHVEVGSVSAAKMSTPFAVSAAFTYRKAGLGEFTEASIRDERVLSLAKRITISECGELTALCPGKRAAIINVHMADGTELSKRVDYPLGEPENPISEDDLKKKFLQLSEFAGRTGEQSNRAITATLAGDGMFEEWAEVVLT